MNAGAAQITSNFEGHTPRDCREHRTVGPHRAWCHDCGEWCYPSIPCRGCEGPKARQTITEARLIVDRLLVGPHPDTETWARLRRLAELLADEVLDG